MKKAGKKNAYIPRVLMMVLTTVLIGVIVAIMLVVGQIQGTARVVNYAGLVRGGRHSASSSWKTPVCRRTA